MSRAAGLTTDHTQQPMAREPRLLRTSTQADMTLPLKISPLRPWARIPHPSPHVVPASNPRGTRCNPSCTNIRLPPVRSHGCRTIRPLSTKFQIPAIISASYSAFWIDTSRSTSTFSMTLLRVKNPIIHILPLSSWQSMAARGKGSPCKKSTRPLRADSSGSRTAPMLHGR